MSTQAPAVNKTPGGEAISVEAVTAESLAQQWQEEKLAGSFLKKHITEYRGELFQRFNAGENVADLIKLFSQRIDTILLMLWQHHGLSQFEDISLVAVGGYGRAELQPHSDVDILILLKKDGFKKADQNIRSFVTQLWDLGLDIGHSVRSIKDCYKEAKQDITVATNIMEARTISGSATLLEKMQQQTGPKKIWNSYDFFVAKREEQTLRHRKHNNTEYNLEPDIKEAPGGLRDIQMISWVAKRHFGCDSLHGLVENDFLDEEEFQSLSQCQNFLWRIRFALHCLLDRPENKLLFDHQKMLAQHLGYQDSEASLAIEQLMKKYYRAVVEISELNDMLLQHFDDDIVRKTKPATIIPINNRFQLRKGYLETTNPKVFERRPSALLEVFVIASQNKAVEDIHINTIRQIRKYRHLIDDKFRNDIRNTSLFIELLNSPYTLFTQLKRMKRCGVLGAYIPDFARIIGQMQYDLFHIYTVDAHTLLLIKNLRRFRYPEMREQFPIAHSVINNLPKIAPLYIAAIFHDIGKGSGRDHSELGAELVISFMERHGFGKWDTELVSWLVKNHLVMSMTTQRKDLADPDVIKEFAERVGNQVRLDYLYVLTVADVNATNPTLWNGWKASLFRELYTKTKQLFRSGTLPNDNSSLVEDRKNDAIAILKAQKIPQENYLQFWSTLDEDYFMRHNALEIAWQAECISKHPGEDALVAIRTEDKKHLAQTQILTYTKDAKNLFAATVSIIAQLNLSVVDARIISTRNGMALNSYIVLDENGQHDPAPSQHEEIIQRLTNALNKPEKFIEVVKNSGRRRPSRRHRQFKIKPEAKITQSENRNYTNIEIRALDQPGLLALIGAIFMQFDLILRNARISTLGETVEDIFFVSTSNNEAISDPLLCAEIKATIEKTLSEFASDSPPENIIAGAIETVN